MTWQISPGKAVGPLTFGMTRNDVAKIVGGDFEQFRRTADSPNVTAAYDAQGLHLTYNSDDRLRQITVFVPNEALLERIQFLGAPLQRVRAQVAKQGIVFLDVDAGLWCEGARFLLINVAGTVDGVEAHSIV